MKPHTNDPKGLAGSKKTPLHLLPPYALAQTALAHAEGAEKYGRYNWRTNKVCATTYIGAILRHLTAWQDGEDIDADSGLSHIAKIGACCNILLDAGHCGTLVDDRSKVPTGMDTMTPTMEKFIQSLKETYPVEPKTPFTKLHAPMPSEPVREARLSGIGKVMVEIEAATTPALTPPPGLPPLPPVPEGFLRWEYRGMGWRSNSATFSRWHSDCKDWDPAHTGRVPKFADLHYIEAVK